MAFWNSEKLKDRLQREVLITSDGEKSAYDQNRVQHCAYELAIGKHHLITGKGKPTEITLSKQGESLMIPPGQFGLLMTEEVVSIPLDAIGFISIRGGIKFKGLVNVSGFHVDPGYKGRLKFSVYNAGARQIYLERGEAIFMLWYADLSGLTKDSYGEVREKNFKITSKDRENMDGEVASPGQLLRDIGSLRLQVRILHLTAVGLLAAVLPLVLEKGCSQDNTQGAAPVTVYQNVGSWPTSAVGSLTNSDRRLIAPPLGKTTSDTQNALTITSEPAGQTPPTLNDSAKQKGSKAQP
jgi:dCTP deaminase